ncbi:MAG: hypothetical protein JW891_00175 [Candidatus Lokiarchaeota archaeon]|nr:hypothetical protein [Candidatus Lokiarchaeota archaeon]
MYCNAHNISRNTINNHNETGMLLAIDCIDNLIFNNYFSENKENTFDIYGNQWDNGSIGNYWDDYEGVDENNDWIGDTPYIILEDPLIKDQYRIGHQMTSYKIRSALTFSNIYIKLAFIKLYYHFCVQYVFNL